ncbi:Os03g0713550, partial [Oryza sativa Japonica Group]
RELAEADGAHERRPARLLAGGEQRVARHEELQDGHAQAPHVGGEGVGAVAVELGVEPLGAHVRRRALVLVRRAVLAAAARGDHLGDPEVGDLHLAVHADEEVARLDVAVDDAAGVEARQPGQRLRGHLRDRRLRERPGAGRDGGERPAVHQLEEQRDVAGGGGGGRKDGVAPDDERGGRPAEYVRLHAGELAAAGGVLHLQRVERARLAVANLVHGAAIPAAEHGDPLEVGEPELAGSGRRRRRRRRRGDRWWALSPGGRRRILEGYTRRDVQ